MSDSHAIMAVQEDMSMQVLTDNTLEQLTKGEVNMQVATAKQWPRDVNSFKRQAIALATASPDIAKGCYYALPRAGKTIMGPSVRLAEIMLGTWGNLRCETRVVAIGEKMITTQATVWDMERNVLFRCEQQRGITDRAGRRFSDDLVVVTLNAASSIALRNAVFRVIPRAYVDALCAICIERASGTQANLGGNLKAWLAHYAKLGVSEEAVLAAIGRTSVAEVTVEDIGILQGIQTALDDRQTTLEDVFGTQPQQPTEERQELRNGKIGFGKRRGKTTTEEGGSEH